LRVRTTNNNTGHDHDDHADSARAELSQYLGADD
jgi:hypothetical protein